MDRIKKRALSRIFSNFPLGIASSGKSALAFFICLLALTFLYRIQLTVGLLTNAIRPFDFIPTSHPIGFTLVCLPYDLALALGCFLIFWLLSRAQFLVKQSQILSIFKISGVIFLNISLMILFLIHGAHMRLLFDAQTGLDHSIIMEVFLNVSLIELLRFIDLRDFIFLLIPIGLFWGILLSPLALRVWVVRVSVVIIIILFVGSLFFANERKNNIPAEIRLNPAIFLLSDVVENGLFKHNPGHGNLKFVSGGKSGIQPIGSDVRNQMKPVKFLPPKNNHPWNIVFFIMESVGTRYMFDTSSGNPMPMPFLHRISKESWHLKRHYTSSNISTKAIFSLLSGLYDFFNQETFGIRSDASVPSIHNFLAESYDRFLVTPSPIKWYFPTEFVKNSGLTEMHYFENLNFRIKEELHSLGRYIGRDEVQTVDFFIQRMDKAREPFLGIYFSFTAHLPYFDYGPEYHIVKDDGRAISRYYNTLNLLDHMIKRIYDHLQKQGLLERTILVIVGDHGQAFGQHHPDNYMHHRYSYNENLETPAIIYQPALFRPKTFEIPTSHVDILPTLLDAMRIPCDPLLFDGESLFNHQLGRKYIFFYGHEGSISSLDTEQIKVQYSLKKNRCWAFDLKMDPGEKNPLDCSSYKLQLEALHQFVNDHDSSLIQYNVCLFEKRDFQGHRHPKLN